MGLISTWGQKLWLEAKLSSSKGTQYFVVPFLYHAKNVAQAWLRPDLHVHHWQGTTQAGELRITFVGPDENKLLMDRLFCEKPDEHTKGRVRRRRVLDVLKNTNSHMTIIQGDKALIERLPRQNSVRLPVYVEWLFDLQGRPPEFKQRIPSRMRSLAERAIRKHAYSFEVSRQIRDFDDFYHNMYVPLMNSRHGEQTFLTPYAEARRYFKQGWLHKVMQHGEFVAGCLIYTTSKEMHVKLGGVKNASEQLRRDGIQYAFYYPILLEANRRGFRLAEFGRTASFANLNIFQYKRRWGMYIRSVPYDNSRMWICIHQVTPAVTQFMENNPLVCVDEHDNLSGLLVVNQLDRLDETDVKKQRHLYLIPGMRSLRLCKMADLVGTGVPDSEATSGIELTNDEFVVESS